MSVLFFKKNRIIQKYLSHRKERHYTHVKRGTWRDANLSKSLETGTDWINLSHQIKILLFRLMFMALIGAMKVMLIKQPAPIMRTQACLSFQLDFVNRCKSPYAVGRDDLCCGLVGIQKDHTITQYLSSWWTILRKTALGVAVNHWWPFWITFCVIVINI